MLKGLPSGSLPATYGFAAEAAAPKEIGLGWESRGSPIYSAELYSRAASLTPVARRVYMTVPSSSVLALTTLLRVRRSHWSFRGCRVHSELKPELILRPASLLALLTRTFTFELALAGSPRASVEYDYVGKQSIPTTGLSPASPAALWAAEQGLTPRSLREAPSDPARPVNRSRVGKGRPAGSNKLRVSPSPSKIPYGGFSPVRLQMDRQWRPSTTARGLSAVHIRPMTPSYTPPQFSLPGIRDPRRDYPF